MNGLGSGGGAGGGGSYQSEDDFDDYNTKPPVYYNSSTSGNVNSGSGINTAGASSGLGTHQSSGLSSSGGGYGTTSQSSRGQICCLVDDARRCHRPAGNASYSKRIQKTVYYKRLRLEIDTHAQHIYICDYHKMVIQNARTSKAKRDSEDDMVEGDDVPEVDLFQLQVNTLRRYKKHFKIPTRPGLNKAQLADVLMRHFKTIPVSEKEIVTYFIYMVKSERNKLDSTGRQENATESMERF